MRIYRQIVFVCVFAGLLHGCGGNDQTHSGQVDAQPTPTPTSSPSASPTIGVNGGTIELPGMATARFAAGSLPNGTTVSLVQKTLPADDDEFKATLTYLGVADVNYQAITVLVQGAQPSMAVEIKWKVTSGAAFVPNIIVASLRNESDAEAAFATWDTIDPTFDAASSTLTFNAQPSNFVEDGNAFVATFILASGKEG